MYLTIIFYIIVVIILIYILKVDYKDYNCDQVLNGKVPCTSFCQSMITGVPINGEPIADSITKVKDINLRLANIVTWRRCLASAIIAAFIVGWLITTKGYFDPKIFVVVVIIFSVVFYFMLSWLSYHYIRPAMLVNNRLYDSINTN